MALTKTLDATLIGVPVSNAYIRITDLSVSRRPHPDVDAKFVINLAVSAYAAEPVDVEFSQVMSWVFTAPLEAVDAAAGATLLERAYNWLVTSNELAGAVSV